MNGGGSIDVADYTGSGAGIVIDLIAGTGDGGDAEGDALISIEHVTGSQHDDAFIGNDSDNSLSGQGGSDFLSGGGGNDRLDGGLGTDNMFGNQGNDIYTNDSMKPAVMERVVC